MLSDEELLICDRDPREGDFILGWQHCPTYRRSNFFGNTDHFEVISSKTRLNKRIRELKKDDKNQIILVSVIFKTTVRSFRPPRTGFLGKDSPPLTP